MLINYSSSKQDHSYQTLSVLLMTPILEMDQKTCL